MDKKALRILWDHNLPFIFWSAAAVTKVLLRIETDGYVCPVRYFLGWCPGCRLMEGYVGFIRTGRAPVWFFVIFGLFILNFLISLLRARPFVDIPRPRR